MKIIDKIKQLEIVRNYILERKYGINIHNVDLNESIQSGIVDKLLNARDANIKYAIILDGVCPLGKSWDKYGDGSWNPKNKVITTEDIKTDNNDKLKEEQNIYDFLRGKPIKKEEINQMLTKEDENIELQKNTK